jgi:branched-chain amino acid transport system permease protein
VRTILQRAHTAYDEALGTGLRRTALQIVLGGVALVVVYALANAVLPNKLPIGIVVLGAVFGSFYALVAIGLVLIYRANRVINFAQAEIGAVAGVLAIEFKLHGLNYWLSLLLGLIIAGAVGALVNVAVVRRFRKAPRLILAVATIGVAQILSGIALLVPFLWPATGAYETPFDFTFRINPALFTGNHLVAMIVVPAFMAAIIAFLRFTDYGIVIRAAAENGDRASLLGVPVPRLSTIVWAIAGVLSATAILMRVPILGFTSFVSVSGGGNALLLRTLAAAVIGRMENLPRTVVAAILIGIFDNAAIWQVPRTTVVDAMLVVIILGALFVQRGHFSRVAETGISTWKAIKEVRPIPEELRGLPEVKWAFRLLRVALLAFVVTFPIWASPSREGAMTLIFVYSMIAVSLLVLTGWAGHISLGQFALVGFGAASTSVLYGRHGWDFMLALVAGTIFTAFAALIIGIPALRIRGPFLAVTTLAFAVTAATFLLEDRYVPWFIEPSITRPVLWGRLPLQENWQMYLFSLAGLMLVIAAARNLRRSHTGRVLIAVRDNEVQSEANTMNVTRLKLQAFVISGAMAGFAGGIYVLTQNGLNTDSFDAAVSIKLFSMVVIGGLGSLPGAVLGAAYVRSAEFFLPEAYSFLATGFGILFLLMFLPEGLGGLVYAVRDTYLRFVAKRRGILVPSLLADKRAQNEDAPVVITTALDGLSGEQIQALEDLEKELEEPELEVVTSSAIDALHQRNAELHGETNGTATGNGTTRRRRRRAADDGEAAERELTSTGVDH